MKQKQHSSEETSVLYGRPKPMKRSARFAVSIMFPKRRL